ncbi:MAG: response regulator [Anaerolineae bacterium]|nr:response regulator [Anaerolineae bacterium]
MPAPQGLLGEVHSALKHLDDPPYLERHPLVNRIPCVAQAPELSRGQALRRAIRVAIAALHPGTGARPGPLEARSYQVLYRWAIAREGMVTIASSLGISLRQAYRDLQVATQALAEVLDSAGMQGGGGAAGSSAPLTGPLGAELTRLAQVSEQDVDLARLLAEVVETARVLARECGVEIVIDIEAQGLHTVANRVMLRQAVLNLLSYAVGSQPRFPLVVRLRPRGEQALIEVRYYPEAEDPRAHVNSPYHIAGQLLQSLDLGWQRQPQNDGSVAITVAVPLTRARTVLIVEDNEGMIALFRGYLRHRPYRVYASSDPAEALELLQHLQPDIVILDVMMPDRDGWEVLQQMRACEAGRRARVIVCSVINDPRLASALGADAFLSKPVDRASLLQVLRADGG